MCAAASSSRWEVVVCGTTASGCGGLGGRESEKGGVPEPAGVQSSSTTSRELGCVLRPQACSGCDETSVELRRRLLRDLAVVVAMVMGVVVAVAVVCCI